MSNDAPHTPAARLVLGLLCIAAGVLPILAALDAGPLHQRDIHGPAWLGWAAGGVFVLAGIAPLAGEPARGHPLSYMVMFLMVVALAAVSNWIAFGPGARQCSGGFTRLLFSSRGAAAEAECRVVFGFGACILDGVLIWMLGNGLRRIAGPAGSPEPSSAWDKACCCSPCRPYSCPCSPILLERACSMHSHSLNTGAPARGHATNHSLPG
jgi:hypothetical protein